MAFKRIVVAGGGTLGSQIAYQTAYSGFQVTIYDINAAAIAAAKRRIATWDQAYAQEMNATPAVIHDTNDRLAFATDLETAVEDADLVIEAVPEVVAIKNDFYAALAKVAPARTIFATNSSTMVPSQFAAITGRPAQFMALHFANHVWENNMAEAMGHQGTSPEVYQQVVAFARQIGMVVIQLHKEQPGYILNTILIPFMDAALVLWVHEVADPQTIDRAWMVATGAPMGPFGILDEIGLRTAYNIMLAASTAPGKGTLVDVAHKIKSEMIDQNKLGQESNQGFYSYPAPAFASAKFLKDDGKD
ncbi:MULTISPECIES: 3-hydroxyacyl-CoA dehydrogenase [Levilactobacillus]|uniref:3-hydroxyacyl-CoA dehydrogenase n=1 Tax=Levilactobacillus TaxID=2767886 RepID=UPI00194FF8BF|nr:3-hydroxyacyl-CoA dehydrogenase [Levilactobacillus sp. 244-2]